MKTERIIRAEQALNKTVGALARVAADDVIAALRDAEQIIAEVRHFAVCSDGSNPFWRGHAYSGMHDPRGEDVSRLTGFIAEDV